MVYERKEWGKGSSEEKFDFPRIHTLKTAQEIFISLS